MAKKNLKQLVVQGNKIIESHYRLSLNENKVIRAMISRIKPDDKEFEPIRFTVKELSEMMGVSGDYYTEIKKITEGLLTRVLRIHNPQKESYLSVNWISSVEYYYNKGCVDLRFDTTLRPYLLELKREFTAYQLQNAMQLNSTHSIRIYELLRQYVKVGRREFEVIELKKILGIQEGEYNYYNRFKERVLLTAQKELSAKTDLSFEFEEIKESRAVKRLLFHVVTRLNEPPQDSIPAEFTIIDQYDLAVSKLPEYERALFTKLITKYKLSKKQSHEVVTGYLPRDGKEKIEALLDYCYTYWQREVKTDPKSQLGAITWTGFTESWQPQLDLFKSTVPTYKPIKRPQDETPEGKAARAKELSDFYKRYETDNSRTTA